MNSKAVKGGEKKAGKGTMPGPAAKPKAGGNGKAAAGKKPEAKKPETKKLETKAAKPKKPEPISPREVKFHALLDKDIDVRNSEPAMVRMGVIVQGDEAIRTVIDILKNIKPNEIVLVTVAPWQMTNEDAQEQARQLLRTEQKKGKTSPAPEPPKGEQVPLESILPSAQEPFMPEDHSAAAQVVDEAEKAESVIA